MSRRRDAFPPDVAKRHLNEEALLTYAALGAMEMIACPTCRGEEPAKLSCHECRGAGRVRAVVLR